MTREEILKVAKPISFNDEMIQAILGNRKTVTRQVIKVDFREGEYGYNIVRNSHTGEFCYLEIYDEWESEVRRIGAPYLPGDILYAGEAWERFYCYNCEGDETGQCFNSPPDSHEGCYVYRASHNINGDARWHSPTHMPKEAARIFLRVKDVRAERLQDISADGIRTEGLPSMAVHSGDMDIAQKEFALLWDSNIKPKDHNKYGWDANPWVFVISFERIEPF